ncbi:MAG: hypothetical protein IKB77_05290 [Lentisphaeria bacterium]|nr:hypothetical protein [Lentisphaeria bacterium]
MKKTILFLLLAVSFILAAEEQIYYPEFEDSVSFYASFDRQTPNADMSRGEEKPANIIGKLNFTDGIRGKAMLCGKDGARVRYLRRDNITFNRPGTLVFFYKGINWHTPLKQGLFLTGIESSKGFFGLQIPAWTPTTCPCKMPLHVMFLYGKKIPRKTISAPISDGKGCDKWHMLAFSWSPGQLRVNADNRPGKTFNIAFDMTDADFPLNVFSIGSHIHWQYLLDEFTVYNRRLSDSEILQIYNKYMKATNK